jgi:uridine phosphorylase
MDPKKYVCHLDVKSVSVRAILCGRRKRALDIIKKIKGSVLSDDDYVLGIGKYEGKDVTVCSHGIGGPSIAIVVRELAALGARRFVRVGSSGALHPSVNVGDVVIATGAVREDGSEHIAPIELPAIASPGLVDALVEVSKGVALPKGSKFHVGLVHSKYDFFSELPELMLDEQATRKKWERLRDLDVLCSEMECGVLFVSCLALSQQMGARIEAGALLVPVGWVEGEPYASNAGLRKKAEGAMDVAIEVALDALTADTSNIST